MSAEAAVVSRAQLRRVREQIEEAEQRLGVLTVLRDQTIIDARRRGLSDAEIARQLDLTRQRVGQIKTPRNPCVNTP